MELEIKDRGFVSNSQALGITFDRGVEILTLAEMHIQHIIENRISTPIMVILHDIGRHLYTLEEYIHMTTYVIGRVRDLGLLIVTDVRTTQN